MVPDTRDGVGVVEADTAVGEAHRKAGTVGRKSHCEHVNGWPSRAGKRRSGEEGCGGTEAAPAHAEQMSIWGRVHCS